MKKYFITIFALALLIVGLTALLYPRLETLQTQSGTPARQSIGGSFSLINQNGDRVTEQSWPDQYKLIYFGFTFCPAICPTELAKITNAMNMLDGSMGEMVQPIFITIDPERDTAPQIKSYLSLFYSSFAGLTGTQDEINQAAKAFRVYAKKVQDPQMTEYTMDHSSFIYFLSPDNKILSIFKMSDTAEDIARTVRNQISQDTAE